jgi:hypothetical protein
LLCENMHFDTEFKEESRNFAGVETNLVASDEWSLRHEECMSICKVGL